MKKRGPLGVLAALQGMPDQPTFPHALLGVLLERVVTWLQPMYPRSEEEETGALPPDALLGARMGGCVNGVGEAFDRRVLLAYHHVLTQPTCAHTLWPPLQRCWPPPSTRASLGAAWTHR